jgi:endonuclease-3
MPDGLPDVSAVIAALQKYYGKPAPPVTSDPFEQVLLEKSGYLTTDEKRERAFRELKKRVGTTPEKIRAAPMELLEEIAAIGGIYADTRALRMKQSAELALEDDPAAVVKLEFKQARKAIAKYPMIGEPGAEKILLFSGAHAVLGLESNGLRVVVRLGFGEEHKNYSTMYRGAQAALAPEIRAMNCARLIVAHQLLRRHGQEICRRSDPGCDACPLNRDCRYAAKRQPARPAVLR